MTSTPPDGDPEEVDAWRTRSKARLLSGEQPLFPPLPFMTPATLELCRNVDLTAGYGACFICSYPKSGTTWTQNIVFQVLTKGACADFDHISPFAPFFEHQRTWDFAGRRVKEEYRECAAKIKRQMFNTHLWWDMLPKPDNARYIYVTRAGADACASFYHHLTAQSEADGGYTGPFKRYMKEWLEGRVAYGRWIDHLQKYLKPAIVSDPRVLVLQFEDMKADLGGAVRKVAAHLGVPLTATEELRVTEQCTFEWMKKNEEKFHPRSVAWRDPNFRFIRKGEVGDSLSLMDADDVQDYRTHIRDVLDASGPDFAPRAILGDRYFTFHDG